MTSSHWYWRSWGQMSGSESGNVLPVMYQVTFQMKVRSFQTTKLQLKMCRSTSHFINYRGYASGDHICVPVKALVTRIKNLDW